MNTRDKLIELIAKAKRSMWGEKGLSCELARNSYIAEYLIANGVTVQQWIPASEPPKKFGRYLCLCEDIELAQIRLYEGEWDSLKKVTHWMPLPPRH